MTSYWSRFSNLKGTVFIVTYGRSGSTLLQSVVQSIDGAHFTGENNLALLPLFNSVTRIRNARSLWGKEPLAPNRPWHGADRMQPDAYRDALIEAFCTYVLDAPTTARWIGFKEIRYAQCGNRFGSFLSFIRASFPNAYFIFNSRPAEEVAQSRWWKKQDFENVRDLVSTMDRKFASYAQNAPDHSIHMKYEEYVSGPEPFRPLFELLNEPFDETRISEILGVRLTH